MWWFIQRPVYSKFTVQLASERIFLISKYSTNLQAKCFIVFRALFAWTTSCLKIRNSPVILRVYYDIGWAYPGININSCLQALTKDISTPADIAPSALETVVFYCFVGYISAPTYYLYLLLNYAYHNRFYLFQIVARPIFLTLIFLEVT